MPGDLHLRNYTLKIDGYDLLVYAGMSNNFSLGVLQNVKAALSSLSLSDAVAFSIFSVAAPLFLEAYLELIH